MGNAQIRRVCMHLRQHLAFIRRNTSNSHLVSAKSDQKSHDRNREDGRTCAGSRGPGSAVCNTVGQTLARPAGHLASPSPFLWSTGNLCSEEGKGLISHSPH